jgi:hypothetical protein
VSFFLTFSISISATCNKHVGTVLKTLYPKVTENEIEKVRKKDTFPAIRESRAAEVELATVGLRKLNSCSCKRRSVSRKSSRRTRGATV